MSRIINDLGTTNSVVAVMEGEKVINTKKVLTTPSVVAWDNNDDVLVGQVARRQAITNPDKTVFSVKRFMGQRFSEAGDDVNRYRTRSSREERPAAIKIGDKEMSPPEISARSAEAQEGRRELPR